MDITNYNADVWRLFIDGSKNSLKAVLMHKLNKLPTIPIAYSTNTKETYEIMKEILEAVNYNAHKWRICCDLKVVAILCGMQEGIQPICVLCACGIQDLAIKIKTHSTNEIIGHLEHTIEQQNIKKTSLVDNNKVLIPPLHVKLGVVKSFIKRIAERKEVFLSLRRVFPKRVGGLSDLRLRAGNIPFTNFYYLFKY